VRMVCNVVARCRAETPCPSWASVSSSRSRRRRGRTVDPVAGEGCRLARRRFFERARSRLARCRCRRSRAVNRPATSVRFGTSKNAPRSIFSVVAFRVPTRAALNRATGDGLRRSRFRAFAIPEAVRFPRHSRSLGAVSLPSGLPERRLMLSTIRRIRLPHARRISAALSVQFRAEAHLFPESL
jgi:hypothetical protein